MLKTEGIGKKLNVIYETYKNIVMPYGHHIYAKAYDMEKSTMWAYSQSCHALPQWKCALRCCSKCLSINLPDQETNDKYPNPSPSIRFHVYHLIARAPVISNHGKLGLCPRPWRILPPQF